MIIENSNPRNTGTDGRRMYNEMDARNRARCITCGCPWEATDDSPAHPVNDTCWRNRPGAIGGPAEPIPAGSAAFLAERDNWKAEIDHLRDIETRGQMMRYEVEALRKRASEDAAEIDALARACVYRVSLYDGRQQSVVVGVPLPGVHTFDSTEGAVAEILDSAGVRAGRGTPQAGRS